MSREWKEYKLDDVIKYIVDNRGKTPPQVEGGYELIETTSIIGDNKYPDYSKISKFVNKEIYEKWFRSGHPSIGDILISTVGANIGNVAIMKENRGCIAQNLIALRFDRSRYSADYLYYILSSREMQTKLKNLNIGSAQPSIKVPHLLNISIKLPPLKEQKAIAHILSTLDEKIEVNNQINKKLEEMAQTIFKHWFVDFEFPNENGEPYKSSGGEMVESELGMIPKGWEVGCIGDYAKVKSGFAFKSAWWKEEGIPVIKIKNLQNNTIDFNDVGYVESDKIEKAKEFIVSGGDLLVAMTGATIGKLGLVPKYDGTILVNQRVGKFFLGDRPLERIGFLYCLVTQDSIYEEIVARGDGSAQPNISPSQIESIKITLPPKEKLDKINNILKEKFELMIQNIKENVIITQLRDTLLPKLMSGELRVPLEEVDIS